MVNGRYTEGAENGALRCTGEGVILTTRTVRKDDFLYWLTAKVRVTFQFSPLAKGRELESGRTRIYTI